MTSSVSLKDLSEEDRRMYNNAKQRRYDNWKRISKEFLCICLEESEEDVKVYETKRLDSERRRLGKKAEKDRLKEEEKKEKKRQVREARYKRNAENVKRWRIENKEHYKELCKESYRRRVERQKKEVK